MPQPPLTADAVRRNLVALAKHRRKGLAYLSRVAGMKSVYLSKFIREGSPRMLPEDVRLSIAMELDIDERLIGGRELWVPDRDSHPQDVLAEIEARGIPSPLAIGLSRLVG